MTQIHITADTDVWTGASTTAQLCAQEAESAVVVSAGSDDIVRRLEKGGVRVVRCPLGGFLASLNLSRALRHIEGAEFEVYVHSPEAERTVSGALRLVGRSEPMTLVPGRPMPAFPPVEVGSPAPGSEPLIMWLGNITDKCGLLEIIDELGRDFADRPWRLRVVGQGKARTVTPILNRAKSLRIDDRIEWAGYSENPYALMDGVSAAIVADPASVAAREFAAASVPVFTKLSDII